MDKTFNFLKKPLVLSTRSLLFQIIYGVVLLTFVFFFNLHLLSFVFGFVFSYIYGFLLFYSTGLLFQKKRKTISIIIIFGKWIFLLCFLIWVSGFIEGIAFLIGLSALLFLSFCYAIEHWSLK